jgi:hypothetical protein
VPKFSAPLSERVAVWFFGLVAWADYVRQRSPALAQTISTSLTFAIALLVGRHFSSNERDPGTIIAKFIVALLAGFLVNRFLLNGLIPCLSYARLSIALRTLGLDGVSIESAHYDELVKKYLKQHEGNLPIRIICISGRRLFQLPPRPGEEPSPLYDCALRGMLDVLMPESNPENPTVKARFDTYSDAVKASSGLRQIDDLIREMEAGKRLLALRLNVISQHKILCFWRLVIFSHHCIVQSYFPNEEGSESHHAPVFVFAKSTITGAYYQTFLSMFNQIKKYTTEAPSAGPVTPSAT